ncbi:MAG TPA: hypothetical protein VEI01_10785 [Terriglobales bacterium]|nr:hypothetical protein [Terriglobales bacterium]
MKSDILFQGPQSDPLVASGGSPGYVQEWAEKVDPKGKEMVLRLSGILLAAFGAAALTAAVLLILGVSFRRPLPAQGAALYNPAKETTVTGVVSEVRDFACPVSDGELGSHVTLKTANGELLVHLAPGRVMRSQSLRFALGEQLTVTGSRVPVVGGNDLIAREVTRGADDYLFRDRTGKLILVQ